MSFFTNLANTGSFLGGVSSAVGALTGGGDSHSKIAKRNQAWTQHYDLHGTKWKVQGLRNAGLNPILAASGGLNPNSSVAASANNVKRETKSEVVSSRAHSALAAAQITNIKKDTELKEAQKDLTNNQTTKVSVEKWNISEDTRLKQKLQDKTLQDIELIKQQALKVAEERKVAVATQEEIRNRILKLKSETHINDQTLKEMFTRFPGLLVEEQIDRSTYGEISRWVNRALPTAKAASAVLGAIGIFRNFNKLGKNQLLMDKSTGEILKGNPK